LTTEVAVFGVAAAVTVLSAATAGAAVDSTAKMPVAATNCNIKPGYLNIGPNLWIQMCDADSHDAQICLWKSSN